MTIWQRIWQSRDRGSGTLAGAALIMLAATLLCVVTAAGHILHGKAVAGTAADAAALAAAVAVDIGRADPCAQAAAAAQAQGAQLLACVIDGLDVQVTASVDARMPAVGPIAVEARAGPQPCGGEA